MKGIKGVADITFTNADVDISMVADNNIIGYSFFIPKSSVNGALVSVNGCNPFPVDPGDSFPYGGMGTIGGCPLVFQDIITVKFTATDPGNKFFVTKIRVPQITEVT
jgi:hypothetical protein